MDSRERTFLALDHEVPDRIPFDFWMSAGLQLKLEAALGMTREAFLDRNDIDLRYIEGPRYVGPPLAVLPDGTEPDIWGVPRRTVTLAVGGGRETYREVAAFPLAGLSSPEAVEAYPGWPSADWFDYGAIKAQCEAVRRQGRVAVFMGDRLNRVAQLKPAMYLRGVEQILLDLSLNPEMARAILGRIRKFYLEYARRIFEAAGGQLDILLMGDDFGCQQGPLLSPRMWLDFLGEGFAAYTGLAHAYGLRVMHHTCGSVRPIVPLMLERGLDVLQSLQPEAAGMEHRALKAEFGGRLAFHGGISIQQTLPFGTPAQVRREVRERVEALAPGGGYILGTSHNIQADAPVENVLVLMDAYREYAAYR
ncbi:MAG: methylcobalamin:coenzyme M methyltransferase [candidate division TA06 bacterium ADurb.Bin417]|uniref:Methylcobalamin:coenzyme M methyltransferase n=1 Tax=candidate division TA06 bacterium ADurb.Bin417 TaxID=1852828 RepID=A0A1V5MBH4_UNCT6|nr:MAG: methylcobalamin:coenzyme M methyltransferase [candidate division TA06 bacterium ADurb.Bin417]